MNLEQIRNQYDLQGQTIVVTGAAGVLCSGIAHSLYDCGANIAVLDLNADAAQEAFKDCDAARVQVIKTNVLKTESLQAAADAVISRYGKIDALINGAGGNHPMATTGPDKPFFDLPADAFDFVLKLNLQGTVLPSQIFGKHFAERKAGSILNISSMNAFRPLTKIPAYSAAKAAVSNFTQWLAVHMAQEYGTDIRVNAIAPGFFATNQNRFLLFEQNGKHLTPRGQQIIDHTPMARFGTTDDLLGAVHWLLSPAAAFVSGIVLPIDGGFSAFSGV